MEAPINVLVHTLSGFRVDGRLEPGSNLDALRELILHVEALPSRLQLLTSHGKTLENEESWLKLVAQSTGGVVDVHVGIRLRGGKGGFGSLLRSKKAKKKTTNFGSARMLDGRRLRDVQMDARIAEADKARTVIEEQEKKRRDEAKLERERLLLAAESKFQQARREIVESIHSAVEMVFLLPG